MNDPQVNAHFDSIPWKPRDVVLAILVAVGGVLALNAIAVVFTVVTQGALRNNSAVLAVFLVFQTAVMLGAVWLFSVSRYHVSWDRLGLRRFPAAMGCALSAALLIASYLFRAAYIVIASMLGIHIGIQQILTRLDTTGPGFIMTLIVGAVIAPIAEEIFFRGFVYAGLRARLGVAVAVLVASIFFTLLHFSLELFIPILALGFFLTLLYEVTGSLYPGIFLHITNNGVALVAYAVVKSLGIPIGG
jgi:membrane protease YdiL (CAAX protease family)